MQSKIRAALGAILFSLSAGPTLAADLPSTAPAAAPAPAFDTFDPWQVRVRLVGVVPTSGNNTVYTTAGALVGHGLTVQSQIIPELDLSYYFTRNIAVEAICCVSYHSIKPVNTVAGVVGPANVGNTWLFPPTITLQYHFTDFGAFQPYVGAGVNYTHYFDTSTSGGLALGGPLKIDDSVGVAVQAGFDYMINRNWGINADLKYVTMAPEAKFVAAGLKSKVSIDPIIAGIGITYRFGGGSNIVVAKY